MSVGSFDSAKIKKTVLHSGTEYRPVSNGCKVKFHFVTKKAGTDVILDDSRRFGKPMELVIGKKFKLEVWETIVQTMAINEVSSYVVHKSLLHTYPIVSKTLRDSKQPEKAKPQHCCAHTLQSFGVGYNDLNELLKAPCDLEFVIELLQVEYDGEYERETWQLSEEDRMVEIPKLKDEGNQLYKEGKLEAAAEKYSRAIGFLDQLMLCEKPGEEEWSKLNNQKMAILSNFAQVKLALKEYYQVIEHCSTIIEHQPENVKALYRRGKAHSLVWNMEDAKEDFLKVRQLDPSLSKCITQHLEDLEKKAKVKDMMLKEQLKGKMF